LFVFALLLLDRGQTPDELARTHHALSRFSTAGTAFVITLLATGLINSWYLVGLDHAWSLVTNRYGQLLSLKVAAFAGMLALAAANRFKLTPLLHEHLSATTQHPPSLRELRRSIAVETLLGLTALALVSWFGTLEPPIVA
jgi:putative copper resistance protein D